MDLVRFELTSPTENTEVIDSASCQKRQKCTKSKSSAHFLAHFLKTPKTSSLPGMERGAADLGAPGACFVLYQAQYNRLGHRRNNQIPRFSVRPHTSRRSVQSVANVSRQLHSRSCVSVPRHLSGAKLIYARLCRYAGKDGKVYPSVKGLGEECGLSGSQVRLYLKELSETGFIRIETNSGKSSQFVFLWHSAFTGDTGSPKKRLHITP